MQVDYRTQVNGVPVGIRSVSIRGQVRRLSGSFNPALGVERQFAQLYVLGPMEADEQRIANHREHTNPLTMRQLGAMMQEYLYVQRFQQAVAAHPVAEEWEMRLIRDESESSSVWLIVVQGRRMRTYGGLVKDNSRSLCCALL